MSKPVMLRTDPGLDMGSLHMDRLEELVDVVTAPDDEPETLLKLAPQADFIFTCYAPITADVIEAASRLRGIIKYGVGVDSIDIPVATRRGVVVAHCPDYGTDTVADHAFALLIALARKMNVLDREIRKTGWLWPQPDYCGVDVGGKTVGLIGFGRIGRAMARRCGGFGMRRLVYDPHVSQDAADWDNLEFTSLDRVLAEADFISLHCVLTAETRHILGRAELAKIKPTAILVNVSRGALVDETALVEALRTGRLAAAGLDVFPAEPLPADHPLFDFANVIVTPHFAYYTREAHERLERDCLDALACLLRDDLPRCTLNPSVRE